MAPSAFWAVNEDVEDEEYYHVLNAVQDALTIVENSKSADDVVRQRLQQQLRELRLGLLSLVERVKDEQPEVSALPSNP